MKGTEVSIVSFSTGTVAVFINFIYFMHGCGMNIYSTRSRATLTLYVSGMGSIQFKIDWSMAISISLFLTAIPFAQLPNSLIGTE